MKIKSIFCIIWMTVLLIECKKDEKETVLLMTVDTETVCRMNTAYVSMSFPYE